ncbi:MAG: Holliday junction branch migration protein RuvA [Cyanobacteriota bacterium]|nr:Holliday junction branch migration protein RuvA [Cyanobacteriota bacterium]MDY6358392.1 Holliday junction branch migration protein RuvA [Cyanobacteriota bacterium]MDY6363299.1 Holliday junction branch migration protein RuvA [Cyanobacteriota bacterium]MDY6383711.1 Holliday junction branch migration protein RuvA [Cyanobacteriota bacterium]
MYDYIKGINTYKISNAKGSFATVETAGTGYVFEIMPRDFELLKENEEVTMYSVLIHKEDKMSLCGFIKREDRDMFNTLTSVSGVGSKMAIALLNEFSINRLVNFVLDADYKSLTKAKGVGPKLAQKIILELKDKLNSYKVTSASSSKSTDGSMPENQNIEDAQNVLISLGYTAEEINNAIQSALNIIPAESAAEDILKKSLQILSL